jgi:hypothetical protein
VLRALLTAGAGGAAWRAVKAGHAAPSGSQPATVAFPQTFGRVFLQLRARAGQPVSPAGAGDQPASGDRLLGQARTASWPG